MKNITFSLHKLTSLGKSTISNCAAKSGKNPHANPNITVALPIRLYSKDLFCNKLSMYG